MRLLPRKALSTRGLPTMSPTYTSSKPQKGALARVFSRTAPRLVLCTLALLALLFVARRSQGPRSHHASKKNFLDSCPGYGYPDAKGPRIDALYRKELQPRLGWDEHYLDATGQNLYWNSQLEAAVQASAGDSNLRGLCACLGEMRTAALGNPHTSNPPSARTQRCVEDMRLRVLRFFGADPSLYQLIWTRSATGALRLLGEAFPWTEGSVFAYLTSNHNSVLGIREYARQYGAAFGAVDELDAEAWFASKAQLPKMVGGGNFLPQAEGKQPSFHLFAYPAMDNYAGVLYPLDWVQSIQQKSHTTHQWKVLLDAAAFVGSHSLNLTQAQPDFVPVSFYKIFGWPTGLGALLVRTDNMPLLKPKYWGGGSAFLATSAQDWRQLSPGSAAFEDGTLSFLDIAALQHGLNVTESLGGMAAVEDHVDCIADWLAPRLADLKHSNGNSMLKIFGKHKEPFRREVQGGTVNFEVLTPDGSFFPYKTVAAELAAGGFYVRTGCMCNPGACYGSIGVRDEEVTALAAKAKGDFSDWQWATVERENGTLRLPLGSVRLSLGFMSRWEDAQAVVEVLARLYRDRKS